MYTSKYPIQTVTADMVVIYQNSVLLIKRNTEPFLGQYALVGGHLDPDDPDTMYAAIRELREEVGITLLNEEVKHVGTYSQINRDPRGRYITVAYLVEVIELPILEIQEDEVLKAEWVNLDDLHKYELAFDHRKIISDSLEMLNKENDFQFQMKVIEMRHNILDQVHNMDQSEIVNIQKRNDKIQKRNDKLEKLLKYSIDNGLISVRKACKVMECNIEDITNEV